MGNGERVLYEIKNGDGKVVAKGEAKGDFTLPTKGFSFWSPENPVRYTLTLTTPEGACSQKFGIRRLVPDGERMRLNGELTYLRGVTEHCYFAETVQLPRDLAYYRMITAKRKELGFNFLRFHTFVPPDERRTSSRSTSTPPSSASRGATRASSRTAPATRRGLTRRRRSTSNRWRSLSMPRPTRSSRR